MGSFEWSAANHSAQSARPLQLRSCPSPAPLPPSLHRYRCALNLLMSLRRSGCCAQGVLPPRDFANGHTFFVQRGYGWSAREREGAGAGEGEGAQGASGGPYSVHLTYQARHGPPLFFPTVSFHLPAFLSQLWLHPWQCSALSRIARGVSLIILCMRTVRGCTREGVREAAEAAADGAVAGGPAGVLQARIRRHAGEHATEGEGARECRIVCFSEDTLAQQWLESSPCSTDSHLSHLTLCSCLFGHTGIRGHADSGRFITVADAGATLPPVVVGSAAQDWRKARCARNCAGSHTSSSRCALVLLHCCAACDVLWSFTFLSCAVLCLCTRRMLPTGYSAAFRGGPPQAENRPKPARGGKGAEPNGAERATEASSTARGLERCGG